MKTYEETIKHLAIEVNILYGKAELSYDIKPKMQMIVFIFDKTFKTVYNDLEVEFQKLGQ